MTDSLIFFNMNLSNCYTHFLPSPFLFNSPPSYLPPFSTPLCQTFKFPELYLYKVCPSKGYLLCLQEPYFSLASLTCSEAKPVKQVWSRNLCVELLSTQLIGFSISSIKIILYFFFNKVSVCLLLLLSY